MDTFKLFSPKGEVSHVTAKDTWENSLGTYCKRTTTHGIDHWYIHHSEGTNMPWWKSIPKPPDHILLLDVVT